jgi:hypothetical protein
MSSLLHHSQLPPQDTPSILLSESEAESELLYEGWFTANQFVLAPSPLRPTTSMFFQLNTCGYKLLLALASAFILGSESRGTHVHISESPIRDSPTLECQVPIFISPRHWVPYSSHLRVTVRVTLRLAVYH